LDTKYLKESNFEFKLNNFELDKREASRIQYPIESINFERREVINSGSILRKMPQKSSDVKPRADYYEKW